MKVADYHARVSGDGEVQEYVNGISVRSSDGQEMFSIQEKEPGVFTIATCSSFKHEDVVYDDAVTIKPVAVNMIRLIFEPYKKA